MKKSVVLYLHLIFWIAILATKFTLPLLTRLLSAFEFGQIALYLALLSPVFFYIGYFLIMKIKWTKSVLLFSALGMIVTYFILFLFSKRVFAFALAPLSTIFLWTTIGALFRFFIDWFKKRNEVATLEKENLTSNMALLHSQINPHFLFNTLNNIDTLIFDNQEKASQSLIKLSNIMRYMLNDAKSDFVAFQKEINHLENYLSLEKIRLKNPNFLQYSIDSDSENLSIAPMILIPFLENAFKHSVDSSIKNGIEITVKIENKKLIFNCKNQFDEAATSKDEGHGIGLSTVKKRLNLIYKNRYQLSINSNNSIFNVHLELELNEN
jgi:two-component system LytT family sensor kinase